MDRSRALGLIEQEAADAAAKFAPFNSAHEGIAVLREEYLELEAECFKRVRDPANRAAMKLEAIQVGAMAVRFLTDLCD